MNISWAKFTVVKLVVQGTDESLCAKGLDKIEYNELNIVFNKNGHKLKGPSVAVPSLGLKVAAAFRYYIQ